MMYYILQLDYSNWLIIIDQENILIYQISIYFMRKRVITGLIQARVDVKFIDQIQQYGEENNLSSESDAIRILITAGLRMEKYRKIMADPVKKQEFEDKLIQMNNNQNLEKHLNTLDADELSAIEFLVVNIKDKKLQQQVLNTHVD